MPAARGHAVGFDPSGEASGHRPKGSMPTAARVSPLTENCSCGWARVRPEEVTALDDLLRRLRDKVRPHA
jgi:hypothetical protein